MDERFLEFCTDVTQHVNKLDINPQEVDCLVSEMLDKITSLDKGYSTVGTGNATGECGTLMNQENGKDYWCQQTRGRN
jgi:hypothetical protein